MTEGLDVAPGTRRVAELLPPTTIRAEASDRDVLATMDAGDCGSPFRRDSIFTSDLCADRSSPPASGARSEQGGMGIGGGGRADSWSASLSGLRANVLL